MPDTHARARLKHTATTAATTAGLLLAAVFVTSCALSPESTQSPRDALHRTGSNYVLERALRDFYDSAFVLTDNGATPPHVVTLAQLTNVLAKYDVVFYGEIHSHPGVHLQEMELFRSLYQHDPRWILSLEHFERDTQGVVNDYLADRIGENALIDQGHAWKNYLTSYRPLLQFAKVHHLPVIAAEAPGWAVSCVGQWGPGILAEFTPTERAWVAADLHATPGPYRDKFMQFLGGSPSHGGGGTSPEAEQRAERSFTAQVTRDDTMAESIAHALSDHPGYKLLHLTGTFHAEGFLGTVERLKLRNPALKIAVIDSVEVENPAAPAFGADAVHDGTALELIYPTPDAFVAGEDTSAFMAKMKQEHDASHCKYSLGDSH